MLKMKYATTALAIALAMFSCSVFAVTSQYPAKSNLTIHLPMKYNDGFDDVTFSDVSIQNGSFNGTLFPNKLQRGTLDIPTTMDNDNYALNFTMNNVRTGNCSITLYTQLDTEKHPLYQASGLGCLAININRTYYNGAVTGFAITASY